MNLYFLDLIKGSKFEKRKKTRAPIYFYETRFKDRFPLIEEGDLVFYDPFGQYVWAGNGKMNSYLPLVTKKKFNPEYWGERTVNFCDQIVKEIRNLKFDNETHSSFCYSKKKIKIGKRKYQIRIPPLIQS